MTIGQLRARWLAAAETKVDTPEAYASAVTLRFCAMELDALTAQKILCAHCDTEAAVVVNGNSLCSQHRYETIK